MLIGSYEKKNIGVVGSPDIKEQYASIKKLGNIRAAKNWLVVVTHSY